MVLNKTPEILEREIQEKQNREDWYFENQLKGFGLRMRVKSRLYKNKTRFQEIEVMETYDYGKLLTLDGLVMITERDEYFYHEILTHPALFCHPNPENVLIIGGGDCGTLREVLKHKKVKNAHLCEIDAEVVNVCKVYFPFTKPALENPKSRLFVEDGFSFLENNKNTYDVIIIDSTDPVGEAAKLFEKDFYKLCHESLRTHGLIAGQAGCYLYETKEPVNVYKNLKQIFPVVDLYTGLTPTYPSGFWSFYFASKKYKLLDDFNENYYKEKEFNLKYYNELIHKNLTALPEFFRKAVYG